MTLSCGCKIVKVEGNFASLDQLTKRIFSKRLWMSISCFEIVYWACVKKLLIKEILI